MSRTEKWRRSIAWKYLFHLPEDEFIEFIKRVKDAKRNDLFHTALKNVYAPLIVKEINSKSHLLKLFTSKKKRKNK